MSEKAWFRVLVVEGRNCKRVLRDNDIISCPPNKCKDICATCWNEPFYVCFTCMYERSCEDKIKTRC